MAMPRPYTPIGFGPVGPVGSGFPTRTPTVPSAKEPKMPSPPSPYGDGGGMGDAASPDAPSAAPAATKGRGGTPTPPQGPYSFGSTHMQSLMSGAVQGSAQKYRADFFNHHWGELTKGLDLSPNNPHAMQDAAAFAADYGVTPGRVRFEAHSNNPAVDSKYNEDRPMTAQEIVQAAKQRHLSSGDFSDLLNADPGYQKHLTGEAPETQAAISKATGLSPFNIADQIAHVQQSQYAATHEPPPSPDELRFRATQDTNQTRQKVAEENNQTREKLAEENNQTREKVASDTNQTREKLGDARNTTQKDIATDRNTTQQGIADQRSRYAQAREQRVSSQGAQSLHLRAIDILAKAKESNMLTDQEFAQLQDKLKTAEPEAPQVAAPASAAQSAATPVVVNGVQFKDNSDGTITHPNGTHYRVVNGVITERVQ